MNVPATLSEHIETTPGVCGGKPRVAGTRIRVQDILVWTEQCRSPEEIVAGCPHLTLADVHAALAYYYDHREAIDRQMQAADALVAALEAQSESKPLKKDTGDSVSS